MNMKNVMDQYVSFVINRFGIRIIISKSKKINMIMIKTKLMDTGKFLFIKDLYGKC